MSVLETIRETVMPKVNRAGDQRLAPIVAQRLAAAKESLTGLRQQHGELSLAVETGEADADKRMAEWREQVSRQEARIIDLEAAHRAALEADEHAVASNLARKRDSDVRSIIQKLAIAHKAVIKMRAAIANYGAAFEDAARIMEEVREQAREAGLRWPGDYPTANGAIQKIQDSDDFCWSNFFVFKLAVQDELLRSGHGPHIAGDFPKSVPGASNYMSMMARLEGDGGFHGARMRGEGGVHDHDAPEHGRDVWFGQMKALDDLFEEMRRQILASIKGEQPAPAPAAPPPELFVGTAEPPKPAHDPFIDRAHLQAPPTITPGAPISTIDPLTKIAAEKQAYAVANSKKFDLRAAVIAKFGQAPEGVPRDKWPALIEFYDWIVEHEKLPE